MSASEDEMGGFSMRGLQILALAAAIALMSALPARADGFVTPYIGFNFGEDTSCQSLSNCEDKRTNFGVTVGSTHSIFGIDADFGYTPNFFGKAPGQNNGV